MANYTAPFHMPKMTDEEFKAAKAEYVAKNGYTITFPNIGDIIKVGINKPMTREEKALWYSGKRDTIDPIRLKELYAQKERSRERYNRMLASPMPTWGLSITSILTAFDDWQDALITLAAIGRIACKFLPKMLTRFLAGPIGWLWLLSELMAYLIAPSACALNPLACKRAMMQKLNRRALTAKGKLRRVTGKTITDNERRLLRATGGWRAYARSGGFLPSWIEGVQMAQTSEQVFGMGLMIGPAMGLAYDLMSGGVRWAIGQDVHIKQAPSYVDIYQKATDTQHVYAAWKPPKQKMTHAEYVIWRDKKKMAGEWGVKSQQDDAVLQATRLHETAGGILRKTDWTEETLFYIGAQLAGQGMQNVLDFWDPIENVDGLEHIEIEAYHEPNPLVEEMLREEGIDPETRIGWPALGKRWATYEEIYTSGMPIADENFLHYLNDCTQTRLQTVGEMSAMEGGFNSWARMEGKENIEIEHHVGLCVVEMLLDKRLTFPETIKDEDVHAFGFWLLDLEDAKIKPTLREVLDHAKNNLGFEFKRV